MDKEDCCTKCLEPFDDNDHMMTDGDPDTPCLSCQQARADMIHDQLKDRDIP